MVVGGCVGCSLGVVVGLAVGAGVGGLVSLGLDVGCELGSAVGIGAIVSIHETLKLHSYFRLTSVQAHPYAFHTASAGGIVYVPYPSTSQNSSQTSEFLDRIIQCSAYA